MSPAPENPPNSDPHEAARLALLRELQVLDTPAEPVFDNLVELARDVSGCDIALINFVDARRHWYKAVAGLGHRQRRRVESPFSDAVIAAGTSLEVGDAAADARFRGSALVREAGVRFYAGWPLRPDPDGPPVGTLGVAGRHPRPAGLGAAQRRQLQTLAQLAEERLRSRLYLARLVASERRRHGQSRLLEAVLAARGIGMALIGADGRMLEVNEHLAELLERRPADLADVDPLSMTLPEARSQVGAAIQACLRGGHRVSGEWPLIGADGYRRTTHVTAERVLLDGEPCAFCVVRDATLEHAEETLEEAERAALRDVTMESPLSQILENVGQAVRIQRPEAMVVVTHLHEGRMEVEYTAGLPPELERVLRADVEGSGCPCGRPGRKGGAMVFTAGARDGAARLDFPEGERHGVRSVWTLPLLGAGREPLGALCVFHRQVLEPEGAERSFLEGLARVAGFALERQDLMAELRQRAEYDALTGLANRQLLADRLDQQLRLSARNGRSVGLLLLDLDDFKAVNDSLGHHVGDRLLVHVARQLAAALRDSDTAARLGGDEFVALLPETDLDAVMVVAEKVLGAVTEPVEIEGWPLAAQASVGATVAVTAERDAEAVLRRADRAMYQAKLAGKGRVHRLEPIDDHGRPPAPARA